MPVTYVAINHTLLRVKIMRFLLFLYLSHRVTVRNSLVLYEWNYWNFCNNLGTHNIIFIGSAKKH